MQWVARLNATLEEQRFRLWYQPIVAVGGAGAESGHHLELLVRLIDEHGRLVEPAAFLPAAERYNLSSRIDRWVVENALDWLASEPDRLQSLALCSINLSGQSLGDEAFFEFLCARTAEHPAVRQGKVCLEVTETAAVA